MKTKTTIIIGAGLILISILLFFYAYGFHCIYKCFDTPNDSSCSETIRNCREPYKFSSFLLIIIGLCFIIPSIIGLIKKDQRIKIQDEIVEDRNLKKRIVIFSISAFILVIFYIVISYYLSSKSIIPTILLFAGLILLAFICELIIPRVCSKDGLKLKYWKKSWHWRNYAVPKNIPIDLVTIRYYKCPKGHIYKTYFSPLLVDFPVH